MAIFNWEWGAICPLDKGRKYSAKSKYNDYGLSDHLSGPVNLYIILHHVNFKYCTCKFIIFVL